MNHEVSVQDACYYGREFLSKSILTTSDLDARILLQYVLGISLEEFIKSKNQLIDEEACARFLDLLERRSKFEPIAYLIGKKSFYDLEFKITRDVLIPRNDSEELINYILDDFAHAQGNLNILDLGTGSGCLIITLIKHLANAHGVAVDISKKALNVAKQNSIKIGVDKRIKFFESNWFDSLEDEKFNIIISNPPYIGYDEVNMLSPELSYEPTNALFAQNNGLGCYEQIASDASKYLSAGGVIYLEIGYTQRELVQDIFEKHGYTLLGIRRDMQMHDRCLKFTLR